MLARTNAQLVRIRTSIEHTGVPVRRRIDGAGSPFRDAVGAASRGRDLPRVCGRGPTTSSTGSAPTVTRVVPTPEQVRVAESVLEFLREQPLGDGVAYRSWVSTTDPFDLRDDRGVELLTFHAAKGREWHTVFVTGVETGLVPIRSATTRAERAEEARLLYVALTRATDDLVVTWCAPPRRLPAQAEPADRHVRPASRRMSRHLRPTSSTSTRCAAASASCTTSSRAWRDHAARAAGILPDDDLFVGDAQPTIADQRPTSTDELAQLTGIGRC